MSFSWYISCSFDASLVLRRKRTILTTKDNHVKVSYNVLNMSGV